MSTINSFLHLENTKSSVSLIIFGIWMPNFLCSFMLDCDFISDFAYSTKNWKLHEKGAISQTNCLSYLKAGYSLSDGIPY